VRNFSYAKAGDVDSVLAALRVPGTSVIASGTELVNWLKEGIATPDRVLDITGLPWSGIDTDAGGLRLGALARMSDVAAHPVVSRDYPVLAESLRAAASAQLRNMATIGGNLLQRTRCAYFRAETLLPCNQRAAGSGCAALDGGDTHGLGIFGWSRACAATHPSDLAVALAALDATVLLRGPSRQRTVPMHDFYRPPGSDGESLAVVETDELIVAVTVPATPSARARTT
jgi:xanthine dehydrogenase YagS FAD-binding subunit